MNADRGAVEALLPNVTVVSRKMRRHRPEQGRPQPRFIR